MANQFIVSWSTFDDYKSDKILSDENGIVVIRYCGQNCGRRDPLIFNTKFFVGGKKGKRKLLGEVLGVTEIPKDKTWMFIIVLKKCNDDDLVFNTKKAVCDHYNWSACDDNNQGITRHTIQIV